MDFNGHTATAAPSQRLLRRLDDPRTADALERLLDRLDLLSFAVDATDGFLRRGEQIADNVGEALADARAAVPEGDASTFAGKLPQLATAGVKLADVTTSPAFSRLLESGLLDRLAAPETLTSLQTLLDKLPLLAFTATAAEAFLQRGEELTDNLALGLQETKHIRAPIDPQKIQQVLAGLPKVIDAMTELINAGLFDPEVVTVLVEVGRQAASSYREAKRLPDHPVGVLGLFQAMRDPAVQRAVGVALHIIKRYGQTFNRSDLSPPPR